MEKRAQETKQETQNTFNKTAREQRVASRLQHGTADQSAAAQSA